ncbi:hypothetical protein FACS1894184_07740 [Clostridia bacterium]|nr:hypothetical protein FACS1894184_07740 [Clostridia bacterium]
MLMQKISARDIAEVRFEEGVEVGKANHAVKMAIKMIKANLSTSEIIKYTELPLSKVLELQAQYALQTV